MTGEPQCDCAYAEQFPHVRAGCRYARDLEPEGDDDRDQREAGDGP